MKTYIKTTGFKELEAALKQMPPAVAKATGKRTLKKAFGPMADTAQNLAPERSGALKISIAVSAKAKGANKGGAAFGAAMRAGLGKGAAQQAARDANREAATQAEMYMGPDTKNGQGLLQEFGTVTNTPQPFMRPAWDAHKDGALDIIKADLAVEVMKSATRLAKKRAKAGL